VSIRPSGFEDTFTRNQLLKYREAEARRLREEQAEREDSDDNTTG
jgi:hypothetical protein